MTLPLTFLTEDGLGKIKRELSSLVEDDARRAKQAAAAAGPYKIFGTFAEAQDAAGTTAAPDGSNVQVEQDETQNQQVTRYRVDGLALVDVYLPFAAINVTYENRLSVEDWIPQSTMFELLTNSKLAKNNVAVHLMGFYNPAAVGDIRTIAMGGARYMYFAEADRSQCKPPLSWIPGKRGTWDGSIETHDRLLDAQKQAASDAASASNPETGMWVLTGTTEVNPYMTGGIPQKRFGDDYNNSPAMHKSIQACLDCKLPFFLPLGIWKCEETVVYPSRKRVPFRGEHMAHAVLHCANRRFFDGVEGAAQSVLHVEGEAEGFSSERTLLENFCVDGGYAGAHGIWFDYNTQVMARQMQIIAVRGCGLYLKNVQDSTFLGVNVLYCGWTKTADAPNDPSKQERDRSIVTNNDSPGWSGVELHQNDEGNDGSNVVRFRDCQIEECGDKSPFIKSNSGVSIWFIDQHSERASDCDVIDTYAGSTMIVNPQFADTRGVAFSGYCEGYIVGGRGVGTIHQRVPAGGPTNVGNRIYVANTNCVLKNTAINGQWTVTNANIGDSVIDNTSTILTGCRTGNLTFKQTCAGSSVSSCTGGNISFENGGFNPISVTVDGGEFEDITFGDNCANVQLGGSLRCGKIKVPNCRRVSIGADVVWSSIEIDAQNGPPNFNSLMPAGEYRNGGGTGFYVNSYSDPVVSADVLGGRGIRAKWPHLLLQGDVEYQRLLPDADGNRAWVDGPKLGTA